MTQRFICKAPWTSIAFQPTGVAPCCIYDLTYVEKFVTPQILFQEVRNDFTNGSIPPGCSKCSQAVDEGRPAYYKQFDSYDTDYTDISIQEINLRSNNFCNLACRSCGPHFSSKWEEEFNSSIVITKDTDVVDKLSMLDVTKLKTVVFAGGEPTLLQEHVYLLNKLIELNYTTPIIRVSTNLHSLQYKDTDLLSLWKNFPNLYLNVSIDAVEDRATAIRSGTNWKLLHDNLVQVSKHNIRYNISMTISALNIWFLEETLNYISKHFDKSAVKFNILSHPDILNLQVIPDKFRENIYNMLDRCTVQGIDVTKIKEYLMANNRSHLWESFLNYNLILDITRKETFFKNLPIAQDLIEQYTRL